jgi:ribonuclease D
VSENNIWLIDTLKIKELGAFLSLIENPKILKISHAGDNDYRLLFTLYGTVPQNTFDTQIAAGFVGYNYPAGFGKIVERELRVTLAKSHTVANWESRPLDPKALSYAVEDVKYLPALHEKLTKKLRKHNREAWSREENRKWEEREFYIVDPYKEVLSSDHIHQLDYREKIFLMRIYVWRRERAIELDVPKETVVQNRHISLIVKMIKNGQGAFRANRTLPENVWKRHFEAWQKLWEEKPTDQEKEFLDALPRPVMEDPDREWTMDLLYHMVKKRCLENEISAALLLPKGDFNRLRDNHPDFDHSLLEGWRAELLGHDLVSWLQIGNAVEMTWNEGNCVFTMKS